MAWFKAYINTFSGYVCYTSTFWDLYTPTILFDISSVNLELNKFLFSMI
jgi:hypothetical protein